MNFLKAITLRDIFLVLGFVFLIYGIVLVYVPAAWIVTGAILLFASYKMAQQ